jgi:hypothetical protein
MVKLRCRHGCRENGGPPQCTIRNCARAHDFPGCWACSGFETCEKLNFLKSAHGDANIKNLKKYRNMASTRSLQERNTDERSMFESIEKANRHRCENIRLDRKTERFSTAHMHAGYLFFIKSKSYIKFSANNSLNRVACLRF